MRCDGYSFVLVYFVLILVGASLYPLRCMFYYGFRVVIIKGVCNVRYELFYP